MVGPTPVLGPLAQLHGPLVDTRPMDDFILTSRQYSLLWEGVKITLQLLAFAFTLGIILSVVFGVARLSRRRLVRGAALVYTEFARGISSLVLLFWMAFALPILLGFSQWSSMVSGSIALGINMGGYGAELVRGAILAVPKGQSEATIALNLTDMQRLRYVILPQAMRVILPPMGNLTIEILKGTALVSLISLRDLARQADILRTNRAVSQEPLDIIGLFVTVLIMYFIMAQCINGLFRLLEWRVERRFQARRSPADTFMLPDAAVNIGPGPAPEESSGR